MYMYNIYDVDIPIPCPVCCLTEDHLSCNVFQQREEVSDAAGCGGELVELEIEEDRDVQVVPRSVVRVDGEGEICAIRKVSWLPYARSSIESAPLQ